MIETPSDTPRVNGSRAPAREGGHLARLAHNEHAIRWFVAIVVAVGSAVLLGVLRVKNLPLDDAYIHLSYGIDSSLASLFSFQGGHRDTGTSSWIWTAIAILVARLRLPEHVTLTVLSVALLAGVLGRVMDIVGRALPRDIPVRWLWPGAAALLLASSGNVLWLSLTGMETVLSLLLLLVVVPRALGGGMTLTTGALALLAIWTRIEAVIWLGLVATLLPLTRRGDERRDHRGWLLPIAGLLIYLAYNTLVSGHLLPTTALAKRASFIPGGHSFKEESDFVLSLTRNYLRPWTPGWLVELGVVAGACSLEIVVGSAWVMRRAWQRRALRDPVARAPAALDLPRERAPRLDPAIAAVIVLLGGAVAHTLVNIVGFRSAYHHLRYFAPALYLIPALCPVLLVHAIPAKVARLASPLSRPRLRAVLRGASVLVTLLPLGVALFRDRSAFEAWGKLYRQNADQLGAVHLAVGAYVRDSLPGVRRVASFDIGALRWASRLQVVDLGGVLDREALRYLETRKPADFVRDTHAEIYVSVENGWDGIRPVQPTYGLVPLRTFQVREYTDPFPPHSKRMVVYRVNHCGEPRVLRREVGAKLSFNFAATSAAARASSGTAEGSSFGRWPVTARDLRHGAPLAEGSFLSSDASDLRDKATGRFETVAMTVEGAWLSFRLAGGYDPERLRIELRSEGKVLATWTGFDTDAFLEVLHPLTDLRGRTISLALIDEAKGGWGHLMLDEVKQFDWQEAPPLQCPKGP